MEAIILEKYIGRVVKIIYEDKKGKITQRIIRVKEIAVGKIRAYDYDRKAPRVFDADRILSHELVARHAS
jgi:predicted DNA-binding transcriptional regulator YafY